MHFQEVFNRLALLIGGLWVDKALDHYKEGVRRELIHRLRSFEADKMDSPTATRVEKYLNLETDALDQYQLDAKH